jgi:hypothetical protein
LLPPKTKSSNVANLLPSPAALPCFASMACYARQVPLIAITSPREVKESSPPC